MHWLMARQIEIAETDDAFSGDQYELSEEGATLEIEPVLLDEINSSGAISADRYHIGDQIKLNALLVDAFEGDSFSGSAARLSYIRDVLLRVQTVDGVKIWYLRNVNLIKKYNLAFKQKEMFLLPITIEGRLDSEIRIGTEPERELESGASRETEEGETRTSIILE